MRKNGDRPTKEFWDDNDWALQNYEKLVKDYPDKWVAVVNRDIVAVGDGINEVEEIAIRKTGRENFPVIFIEGRPHVY